jgi:hypothetical protein
MLVNTPLSNFGLGFAGSRDRYGLVAIIPIWFPAMLTSIVAVLPLIKTRPRFSLLALLIGMTLVAAILGAVVFCRQIGLLCFVHSSMSETIPSPTLKYRKLRIAFSAVCGIVCLLLIALWVSSYYKYLTAWWTVTDNAGLVVESGFGKLNLRWEVSETAFAPPHVGMRKVNLDDSWEDNTDAQQWHLGGFAASWNQNGGILFPHLTQTLVVLPYWFITTVLAIFASVPLTTNRWRFSLRTLLVAMTLIAAILGLIVRATW